MTHLSFLNCIVKPQLVWFVYIGLYGVEEGGGEPNGNYPYCVYTISNLSLYYVFNHDM